MSARGRLGRRSTADGGLGARHCIEASAEPTSLFTVRRVQKETSPTAQAVWTMALSISIYRDAIGGTKIVKMMERWDETWHRLLIWTAGQGSSERLAAQVLMDEGFKDLDPSHPLGGPDGGKDAIALREGQRWIMAVYFPRGQQAFAKIKDKFTQDLRGVAQNAAAGIAFVTNQELSLTQREELAKKAGVPCEIYHLERLVAILDQPKMLQVRAQYLQIDRADAGPAPQSIFVHSVHANILIGNQLVGRSDDLDRLANFLAPHEPKAPHVGVVVGMPGVGKTALVTEAAARARRDGLFTGGTFVADFRGYDGDKLSLVGPDAALPGLLLACGAERVEREAAANFVHYRRILDDKHQAGEAVLLIFDNVADIRQVADLIPPPGTHRVVITSRNSLGPRISSSKTFTLLPLEESESIELIRQEVGSALGKQIEGLTLLAQFCDGLPVALKLVSQILVSDPNLSPRDLANEFEEEATRLAGLEFEDSRIRAVFNGSYTRLSDRPAKCFRYLSIHPGRELTLQGATYLLGVQPVEARRALRSLESAHLISREQDSPSWRLHDLLRLYGIEKAAELDARWEQRAGLRRLFDYYFDVAEQLNGWVNGSTDPDGPEPFTNTREALEWAALEQANIISCISAAIGMQYLSEAWKMAISINPYLTLRGDLSASTLISESALNAARTLEDREKEAGALNNLGLNFNLLNRYQEARTFFIQARRIYRELADKSGEARVLTGLCESMRGEGNVEDTVGVMRRAVRLYTEARDGYGLGFALTNLGTSLRELGRHREAADVLARGLLVHQANGAQRAEAATLGQLGTALGALGNLGEAINILTKASTHAEAVGDGLLAGMALMNLGNAWRIQGHITNAESSYLRSLEAFEGLENSWNQAVVLRNLVALYRATGQIKQEKECAARIKKLGPDGLRAISRASRSTFGTVDWPAGRRTPNPGS